MYLDYHRRGAFVISLDFELHWGVRDRNSVSGPYRSALVGARTAIPRMLELFEEFQTSATWATVGFLFAKSRCELREHYPSLRPRYWDPRLDPYKENVGESESEDELHYGWSLISQILKYSNQEVGCHTFSHYYCLEGGQTRETFDADLASAVKLALKRGVHLRSIVFPRNQVNAAYLDLLVKYGFTSYRGAERGWMYKAGCRKDDGALKRAARLTDQYVPVSGSRVVPWNEISDTGNLCNIRGGLFLRPYSKNLHQCDDRRLQRISGCIHEAATSGGVFHLWWHPHNFGQNTEKNLAFLRSILLVAARYRDEHGLESLSMAEVAKRTYSNDESSVCTGSCDSQTRSIAHSAYKV